MRPLPIHSGNIRRSNCPDGPPALRTSAAQAAAFPAARLAPPLDSPARGPYYRWMFFGGCCVEPAVIDRMLSRPAASRPAALGYGCYEDTVATLEKALTPGPYILGAQFSAADVYIGSQIGFGMMMKGLEPPPAVPG